VEAGTHGRMTEFTDLATISLTIESMPLSLDGAGIARLSPIVLIGHSLGLCF
jgi:hypothetical protein